MLLLSHNEKPWILEICGGNVSSIKVHFKTVHGPNGSGRQG